MDLILLQDSYLFICRSLYDAFINWLASNVELVFRLNFRCCQYLKAIRRRNAGWSLRYVFMNLKIGGVYGTLYFDEL